MGKLSNEKECKVEDCFKEASRKGLCFKHYTRLRRHGDVDIVLKRGGPPPALIQEKHPNWSGANASYQAIHKRLARVRGKASEHVCVDCGSSGNCWSYNHSDPSEKSETRNNKTYVYSLELKNYEPRCIGCHTKYDKRMDLG